MALENRRHFKKNISILSHECVIQNHADIASYFALLFVIGLMVEVTAPFAYMFIALHHNVNSEQITGMSWAPEIILYTYGWKDVCAVFFYFLICIMMHANIQEHVLDKISRKLNLSKVKHSKFSESGQLLLFYLMSVLWSGAVIFRENYIFNISSLWECYPHNEMVFMLKLFYIVQLSYWLHCYPELYFQKAKREEMSARITYTTLGLVYILGAYLLNFSRVGICLLALHYTSEALFHAARLIDFVGEEKGSKAGYLVANAVFVFVRLASTILSVLTFWYGLPLSDNQGLDIESGNFNTVVIRTAALLAVCLPQAWLVWNFITIHLKRLRKEAPVQPFARTSKSDSKKRKEEYKRSIEAEELLQMEQDRKMSLRPRIASRKPSI
jgi:translocating chain-associated membrane protein 1